MVACARARARLYQGFQRNTVSVVKDIECHVLFKEIALSPFNLDRSRFNETEVYRGEDMNVESPDRSRETGGGGENGGRAGGGRVFRSLREFLQSVLLYRVRSPRIGRLQLHPGI